MKLRTEFEGLEDELERFRISIQRRNKKLDLDYYTKSVIDAWRNNVSQTEMGYLDGVSSDVQTQITARLLNTTDTFTGNLSIDGSLTIQNILISSETNSDNFVVNSAHNIIEEGADICVISGGGNTGSPNLIGDLDGLPTGGDKLSDPEWVEDEWYVADSADVATIGGGYDHVNNQLAGTISGGGHNFIRYNSIGHSVIGGGSYNLISASRSGIFCGRDNSITGDFIYSVIPGGYNNRIIGSYSTISGGADNKVTGNYSFVFGRHALVVGAGTVLFRDASSGGDYTVTESNYFVTNFTGAHCFMGSNVGIGETNPTSILQVVGIPVYANNAAATGAGLTAGAFYRTGADPDPVCVVH